MKFSGENDGFKGCYSEAIWPFFAVGQIFGVMPVCGIKSSTFYFKWTSFRTFYSLFVMIVLSTYSSFLIWQTFSIDASYSAICNSKFQMIFFSYFCSNYRMKILYYTVSALLLFYVSNTCELISFFVLALHWPEIMKGWENAEKNFPSFRSFRQKRNFILKIRLIVFTMLFLAASKLFRK